MGGPRLARKGSLTVSGSAADSPALPCFLPAVNMMGRTSSSESRPALSFGRLVGEDAAITQRIHTPPQRPHPGWERLAERQQV